MFTKLKAKKFLVVLWFFIFSIAAHAKIYLVSVGVGDYPETENDLGLLPVRDAKKIVWIYSNNSEVEYVLLLDQKSTKKKILAAMNKMFSKAKTNDIIVFFFSGHGYPGGFLVYDGQLPYELIRNAMVKGTCKNKMIFADACFSGKIRTGKRNTENSMAEARKANVMLFLSSREDETSLQRSFMNNGFFTTFLDRGLRGHADKNKDRIITARELFDYVHNGVVQISSGKQHPVMWGKFPDNMPVMVW